MTDHKTATGDPLIVYPMPENPQTSSAAAGRRLREELDARGLTKSAAARQCNVSQSWLWRRVMGRYPMTLDDIATICAALDIDRVYILTGAQPSAWPEPEQGAGDETSPR